MGGDSMAAHTHANPETHFGRGSWLTLILASVFLVYGIAVLAYRFTLPTDGWEVFAGGDFGLAYTKNLMGIPSGLQPGDRVVALKGFPADWLNVSPALRDAWRAGATIDYTVIRDGREIHVPVTLAHWQLGHWLLTTLHDPIELAAQLAGYFLLILAAILFLRRPGNSAASAFLLYNAIFISNGLVTATLPSSWPEVIDPTANLVATSLGSTFLAIWLPSALIRFALVFPRPKPILRRLPWLAYAPLVIGAGIEILTYRTANPLGWFWFLLSLVLIVAIMIHNAFTMRDAVSRAQIQWGLGGLIFNFGLLTLTLMASTFGWMKVTPDTFNEFFNLISAAGIIVMGISLAIAITRYRLFDIDVVIRKTLVYAVLTALMGLVYFGGVTLLQSLFTAVSGQSSPAALVISTLVIAALFNPLRRRIQEFIDRHFYRQKYDAELALAQFAAAARSETEIGVLADKMMQVTQEALQPKSSQLWLIKKKGITPERSDP
jgi:hypothetical protein